MEIHPSIHVYCLSMQGPTNVLQILNYGPSINVHVIFVLNSHLIKILTPRAFTVVCNFVHPFPTFHFLVPAQHLLLRPLLPPKTRITQKHLLWGNQTEFMFCLFKSKKASAEFKDRTFLMLWVEAQTRTWVKSHLSFFFLIFSLPFSEKDRAGVFPWFMGSCSHLPARGLWPAWSGSCLPRHIQLPLGNHLWKTMFLHLRITSYTTR